MFNLVQDLKLDKEIKMVETNTQEQQEPFAVFERGDRGEGVRELRNFGDSYGARRNREANYLTSR